MPESYKSLIDKVIYGLLATVGIFLIKFIIELSEKVQVLNVELTKITSQIGYQENQLRAYTGLNSGIYRLETEMGMHEKRLVNLEKRVF